MKKIPTVFRRDPENMKTVLPEVTPGCEWVLEGIGVPTRKYDGTCCMYDGLMWWARREVKPGKQVPDDFRPEMTDDATGKTVGWVPMIQSAFVKYQVEALEDCDPVPGTYELCGPKINGNPEEFALHVLIPHADAEEVHLPEPSLRSFEEIRRAVVSLGHDGWEGIVWHHPDGYMAKLKARDFPNEARRVA